MNLQLFQLLDIYFKNEIRKATYGANDASSFDYNQLLDRSTLLRDQILKYLAQQEGDSK